jgi:hypothetical protein
VPGSGVPDFFVTLLRSTLESRLGAGVTSLRLPVDRRQYQLQEVPYETTARATLTTNGFAQEMIR